MKQKTFLGSLLSIILVLGTAVSVFPYNDSTVKNSTPTNDVLSDGGLENGIGQAIDAGLAWLVAQQHSMGYWGSSPAYRVPYTAFVLIKLQERAYELGYDSPFDPEYSYSSNVIAGWDFLFSLNPENGSPFHLFTQTLTIQDHTSCASGTLDNPDTNGNGYGIYFNSYEHYNVYSTGIVLTALEASGTPEHSTGIDVDDDGQLETFFDIAQDAADWLAFAQGDFETEEGGWFYTATSEGTPVSYRTGGYIDTDNSNSGYAVLGLAAAEGFGCTVPNWVKIELSVWIDVIQDDVDGDTNDGGSWYRPNWERINLLKTGNLLFEMTFVGDTSTTQRFQDAIDYIERHWNDPATGSIYDVGWKDPDGTNHHYQAMYCLMKGFEYSQVELIDLDGDNVAEHDWFQEFAQALINSQTTAGYWTGGAWGDNVLNTVWALLTLERVIPSPPAIEVNVDVKPCSWPNPLNPRSRGVVPVAIYGTADFDVRTIDPATVRITAADADAEVAPIRWSYEKICCEDCCDGDDYLDIVFFFKNRELFEMLDLSDHAGETVQLLLTGNLCSEEGGTAIHGSDTVWILKVPKRKGHGPGNCGIGRRRKHTEKGRGPRK